MKIFEKASWHIDAGENKSEVLRKIELIMQYLKEHNMLSPEGIEIYELGIDESISITERMVTPKGYSFLDERINEFLASDIQSLREKLI